MMNKRKNMTLRIKNTGCDNVSPDSGNALCCCKGFTLIEIMVVVVLLAIAAAMVVPMASSAAPLQLRSAVNMIVADIEYAKSLSVTTGLKYAVIFNANNESYSIEDPNGDVITNPVKPGFNYTINFSSDGRLNRVNIVSVDFDSESGIKFDYLGSPYSCSSGSSSGSTLSSAGTIVLSAGGSSRTITVAPMTGFVSISN